MVGRCSSSASLMGFWYLSFPRLSRLSGAYSASLGRWGRLPMDLVETIRLVLLSGWGLVALVTAVVLFLEWRRNRGR